MAWQLWVEDDTAYYIVMCRDIKERMTEDDLWTETQQNTVISQAYSDAFEDMLALQKKIREICDHTYDGTEL